MFEISEKSKGEIIINLKEKIDVETSPLILKKLSSLIKIKSPCFLTINLAEVSYFDDFGALLLLEIRNLISEQNGSFKIINATNKAKEILSLVKFDSIENYAPVIKKKSINIFIRIGGATINEALNIKFIISFIGSAVLALIHACFCPKSLRINDTIIFMEKTGADALPIVALISFLLGLIMAFVSAMQLRQFGADIYVASLVVLTMVSELGPIITAIIVAGRSGSAFAAEIGTMKISEEIDALITMGFDPILFLAVPRIIASVIVIPILTLFSDIFAIAGGLFVGVFMLDLTPNSYINQTLETLTLVDVVWGMLKSAIFAILIACTGCLRGFQAKGGATAVGNAATSAVVSSIFLIILFDSIFAVIRSYW